MDLLLNHIILQMYANFLVIIGTIMYLAIPLAWWLIAYRRNEKFFSFIGISKPHFRGSLSKAIVFAIVFVSGNRP